MNTETVPLLLDACCRDCGRPIQPRSLHGAVCLCTPERRLLFRAQRAIGDFLDDAESTAGLDEVARELAAYLGPWR